MVRSYRSLDCIAVIIYVNQAKYELLSFVLIQSVFITSIVANVLVLASLGLFISTDVQPLK